MRTPSAPQRPPAPAGRAMTEEVFFEAKLRRAPVARDFGLTILACEEGWHTITQVEPGGEGEQSGLAVGDRICEVNGKPLPRKLHSIVTYLPSRDSDEYVNLGVRRGPAKLANEPAATAPQSPSKPGVSLEAAKRGAAAASKAKTKPSSLGAAAEAKAAAEVDAAVAAANAAARGEPVSEPESPLGDRIAVHTSEGVMRTKPGGGAPASASAGTAKREAAEAKGRDDLDSAEAKVLARTLTITLTLTLTLTLTSTRQRPRRANPHLNTIPNPNPNPDPNPNPNPNS